MADSPPAARMAVLLRCRKRRFLAARRARRRSGLRASIAAVEKKRGVT